MVFSTQDRLKFIREHEQSFADLLGLKVLQKPRMEIWMIIIPIIFVFYLNDLKKYKDGRQAFAANYLLSRESAIAEAADVVLSGREPDLQSLAAKVDLPPEARLRFVEMLAVLVEHYLVLIRADGENYQELLRNGYASYEAYADFLKRINEAEKALNQSLKFHLEESAEEVGSIVSAIEKYSAEIRITGARNYFA